MCARSHSILPLREDNLGDILGQLILQTMHCGKHLTTNCKISKNQPGIDFCTQHVKVTTLTLNGCADQEQASR